MAKGYSAIVLVERYLGRTLTGVQIQRLEDLLDAVEAYVDRETRRSWLVPPISDERYPLLTPTLYLRFAPVSSIEQVQTRQRTPGDVPVTLRADVDYELLDDGRGELQFSGNFHGDQTLALVSYTPNRPVPSDITEAATEIAAQSLAMAVFPDRWGVTSVAADEQVHITYQAHGLSLTVPAGARSVLDGYNLPLVI